MYGLPIKKIEFHKEHGNDYVLSMDAQVIFHDITFLINSSIYSYIYLMWITSFPLLAVNTADGRSELLARVLLADEHTVYYILTLPCVYCGLFLTVL